MRHVFLVILFVSLSIAPMPVFAAQECATSSDIGKTYCTCDDGSSTYDVPGHEFDAATCNAACWDRGDTSWLLESCDSPDATNPGISAVDQNNVSDPSASGTTSLTPAAGEEEADYIVPTLLVPIPGFSNSSNENNNFSVPTRADDNSKTSVNFLAEYINAIYGWILGAAALAAVVMMMIGGLQYVLARGKPKYIDKAKTRITNAITGMVLLLAAYNIAFLIDPRLTNLEAIGVKNVEGIEYFPPDGEDDNVTPNISITGTTVPISGSHITAGCKEGCTIDADTLTALQTAATTFYNATGKNVKIASATRSLAAQASIFYEKCLARGGVCKPTACNASTGVVSKTGSKWSLIGEYANLTTESAIVAALSDPAHAAYGNCPHTSTIAVDAWCDDGGTQYRHDVKCQGQLITAMISAGFCRLSSEPWHFELDTKSVSTACSTSWNTTAYTLRNGNSYNPENGCQKWDFDDNFCVQQKIE